MRPDAHRRPGAGKPGDSPHPGRRPVWRRVPDVHCVVHAEHGTVRGLRWHAGGAARAGVLGSGWLAIVLGTVIGSVPVAVLCTWGPRTGTGQVPLARLPFGKTIVLPGTVQWLSSIAWDALVGLFGGQAAAAAARHPVLGRGGDGPGRRGPGQHFRLRVRAPAAVVGLARPDRPVRRPDGADLPASHRAAASTPFMAEP